MAGPRTPAFAIRGSPALALSPTLKQAPPAADIVAMKAKVRRDYGTRLLAQFDADDELRAHADWARGEGVRVEDFAGYWGQSTAARRNLDEHLAAAEAAFFDGRVEELGGDEAAAAARTLKALARYGTVENYEEDSAAGVPEQDRTLPIELVQRVNRWGYRKALHRKRWLKESATYSSMNAQIRAEIAAGRL